MSEEVSRHTERTHFNSLGGVGEGGSFGGANREENADIHIAVCRLKAVGTGAEKLQRHRGVFARKELIQTDDKVLKNSVEPFIFLAIVLSGKNREWVEGLSTKLSSCKAKLILYSTGGQLWGGHIKPLGVNATFEKLPV